MITLEQVQTIAAKSMDQAETVRELRLIVEGALAQLEPPARMAFLSTLATQIFLDVAKETRRSTEELLALWPIRMRLNFARHAEQQRDVS